MQGASMMTAMRTANRVVAQYLLKHSTNKARPGDPNRFVEHTFDELQQLAEAHGDEVTRELEKTASMSIQTFWRHFARFLMGQEDTNAASGAGGGLAGSLPSTGTPRAHTPVGSTLTSPMRAMGDGPYHTTGGGMDWYMKDHRWAMPASSAAMGSVGLPAPPQSSSALPSGSPNAFTPTSMQHVEQIKRGEVIDHRLLRKFEHWLTQNCYMANDNAWASCLELNDGIRMVLNREGKGMFIPDAPAALDFFNTFEKHPLMADNSSVLQKFHDFVLESIHRGVVTQSIRA